MRVSDLRKLTRGTIVRVGWTDICEEPTGDPRRSYVVVRHTLGHIWDVKRDKCGAYVLTMTFTTDTDGPDQSGWICIPVSNVLELEVIRREKGK